MIPSTCSIGACLVIVSQISQMSTSCLWRKKPGKYDKLQWTHCVKLFAYILGVTNLILGHDLKLLEWEKVDLLKML